MQNNTYRVAILIPCYNEEATVGSVIESFRESVPDAAIYVFNNNSKDRTAELATEKGAVVYDVKLPGKGNVVRRMFADIEADVYLMVDGDGTYDATSAPELIRKLVDDKLDMVVGCRVEDSRKNNNYRVGHRLGNRLLTDSVQKIFNGNFTDMLSGYRVFSKRFVKSFPAASRGFEIETELTVFTLELKLPYGEVATPYYERPEGSESKLSTYRDGLHILMMIIGLYSSERPARFWGSIGAVLIIIASVMATPIVVEYVYSSEVPRFPTLIVASVLGLGGFISFVIGIVLRTVTKGRNEAKHLAYLSIPATSTP